MAAAPKRQREAKPLAPMSDEDRKLWDDFSSVKEYNPDFSRRLREAAALKQQTQHVRDGGLMDLGGDSEDDEEAAATAVREYLYATMAYTKAAPVRELRAGILPADLKDAIDMALNSFYCTIQDVAKVFHLRPSALPAVRALLELCHSEDQIPGGVLLAALKALGSIEDGTLLDQKRAAEGLVPLRAAETVLLRAPIDGGALTEDTAMRDVHAPRRAESPARKRRAAVRPAKDSIRSSADHTVQRRVPLPRAAAAGAKAATDAVRGIAPPKPGRSGGPRHRGSR
mmetsp:Transcript_18503/g.63710  ORF Transcript_18503/g.63710 Transcript_18503/m.63710 type:complete len:284 (+) Transcript_18503:250-1101(+)